MYVVWQMAQTGGVVLPTGGITQCTTRCFSSAEELPAIQFR
jgi:hypothetical protein